MAGNGLAGNGLKAWLTAHRVELGLCVRVSVSAVLSLAVAQLLNLTVALWTVLTAVVLTQLNVGRSLKATTDYLTGTLGAAIYAGAVGALVPHTNEISLLLALAIAVAPATLLAAMNPRFSAAPFTAVLVFLAPTITHAGPVAAAFERLIEVAVGAAVGLAVSLTVFPARAHDLAIDAAVRVLDLMARLLPQLLARFTQPDGASLMLVQNSIGQAFTRFDVIAREAQHERLARLVPEPDQGPLLRTLLRLRHDLVMIGRAAILPLPERLGARFGPLLARVGETAADYLRACGAALLAHRDPPPSDAVASALNAFAAEMAALRHEGLTRDLPTEAAEHVFALGFALDQLHQNFNDLARCVAEFSSGPASIPDKAESASRPPS